MRARSRPSIPYIPEKDVIQEAVDSSANMLKLMLPHKVELHVPVWSKGPFKQFLVHVQQALDAIRQKDLQTALEKAIKDKEECTKKLVEANEALANYKGRDETPPPKKKAVQKATPTRRRLVSPSLPRYSSYMPTYLQRKLGDLGVRY